MTFNRSSLIPKNHQKEYAKNLIVKTAHIFFNINHISFNNNHLIKIVLKISFIEDTALPPTFGPKTCIFFLKALHSQISMSENLDLGGGALNLSSLKESASLLNLSGLKETSGGVLELCVVCGDRASGMLQLFSMGFLGDVMNQTF